MPIRRNNGGRDSRKLLVPITHPDNIYARQGAVERAQRIDIGGLIGGGDPTRIQGNPVPVIISAAPNLYYDAATRRTVCQIVVSLGYVAPADFAYLEANIYAESGDPGHNEYFITEDDTPSPWAITDTSIVIGATYSVRVRAATARGFTRWSDAFTGIYFNVILVAPAPAVITTPVTGGYNPHVGYFAAPIINHSGGLDSGGGFVYYQANGGTNKARIDAQVIPPGTTFPYQPVVGRLAVGVLHTIWVVVISEFGVPSAPSNIASYLPNGVPVPPPNDSLPNPNSMHPDDWLPGLLQTDPSTHAQVDQSNLPDGIFIERVTDKSFVGRAMITVTIQDANAKGGLDFSDQYQSGWIPFI